jgi:uncharacterized Zn finger protein (UPF0148 family)
MNFSINGEAICEQCGYPYSLHKCRILCDICYEQLLKNEHTMKDKPKKRKYTKKHYRQISDEIKKIEAHMTEIQRHLDVLYQISNRLYEMDV